MGWTLEEEDDDKKFLVAPFGGRFELGNPKNGHWYCIQCWESKKYTCHLSPVYNFIHVHN
jgi:hypothetical protein